MSHGSEGSKGQTRHRYLQWMEKEPRTKKEMAAYQKGAGKVGIETTSNQRGGSKPTQPNRQQPILQRPEVRGLVEKTQTDTKDMGTDVPLMEMPFIQNLKRHRG